MLHFPFGQAALSKINHGAAPIIRRNIRLIANFINATIFHQGDVTWALSRFISSGTRLLVKNKFLQANKNKTIKASHCWPTHS